MTKRCGSYQGNNGKKLKLEDELWDDIDDDALNECFEVASQAYNENNVNSSQINGTILPSYNSFKHPNAFASSTQTASIFCSTSSKKLTHYELEAEIQRLRRDNEEKIGEISILRSKMKDTSCSVQLQQQKTIVEWREKLQSTEKEVNSIKSQLEFKNLEIANLKQHITKLRRITVENNNQQIFNTESIVKVNCERNITPINTAFREPILEPIYPLKGVLSKLLEENKSEIHAIKSSSYKLSRNTIPYLQNQQSIDELNPQHNCVLNQEKFRTLNNVYGDIMQLVNSDFTQLSNNNLIEPLSNLIYFTWDHLNDLNDYVVKYISSLQTEYIQQADRQYLLPNDDVNVSSRFEHDELGIKVSHLLEFISEVSLFSKYMENYFCYDGKLSQNRELLHLNQTSSDQFLKLLLDIVKNIGKCRKASVSCKFLISVTHMLINIGKFKSFKFEQVSNKELLFKLFKELIFIRPNVEVIKKLTFLLKVYSQSKDFILFLFSKVRRDPLESNVKGILYYTEGSCTFCVLSLLLQDTLLKVPLSLEICHNLISFLYNTFKIAYSIHQDNTENICSCLSQLYKLEIECVFKTLESFTHDFKNNRINCDRWRTFLNHDIIQTGLNLMNFNNYELTEKYILVYCQFKECEQILKQEQIDITQFNTSEDLIKIPENMFNVDF